MTIQNLLDSLIKNPTKAISIKSKNRKIVGFAEFKTVNLGDDNYYKISFEDHSYLLIVPDESLLFFADKGSSFFNEIADDEIGNKKEITFKNKKYILENAHDYQYVVRLIVGDWKTIEGEVKFSDYISEDGSESLSLGWLVRTGERADVVSKELKINEVEIK